MEELVQGLMSVATREEKETFDKVYRSDEKKIMKEFGKEKEEVLQKFMEVWAMRLQEEAAE